MFGTSEMVSYEGVLIQTFDFTTVTPIGMKSGFYWHIPGDADEQVHPAEIKYVGPFASQVLAIDSAEDFIEDAISEHEGLDCSDEEAEFVEEDA